LIALTLAGFAGWAEINRREANVQRLLADERRQEAERNFAVAKQAANSLVFDIAQGLRNVGELIAICVEENDRRLKPYDNRLKRPRLVPFIARLALKFIGPKKKAA